jgi:hypothetical protein
MTQHASDTGGSEYPLFKNDEQRWVEVVVVVPGFSLIFIYYANHFPTLVVNSFFRNSNLIFKRRSQKREETKLINQVRIVAGFTGYCSSLW